MSCLFFSKPAVSRSLLVVTLLFFFSLRLCPPQQQQTNARTPAKCCCCCCFLTFPARLFNTRPEKKKSCTTPPLYGMSFSCFFTNLAYRRHKKKKKRKKKTLRVIKGVTRSSAVTHLASATPNMQPPTVDQKPIQPAPTCAFGGAMEGKVKKKRREGQRRGERRGGYWCLKCSP